MLRKLQLLFIMVGVLGLTLTGADSVSAASNNGAAETNEQALEGAEAVAPPAATTGSHARLVALIDQRGTIIRSAGVRKVTHPSNGVYCIRPRGTWNLEKVVPAVSVELGYSTFTGNPLLAYYYSAAIECPDNYIEVRTYEFSSGTAVPAETVGFTIVVP